ncbi:zinc finger C2HC domain-containing protein 1A-like [Atheta coriaria]|uniref:zinc finger C2HC domain-containing protein 1A-like n=1 Tax=Dalotia coriaria TaxID=877792 RepID=UPI0031F42282
MASDAEEVLPKEDCQPCTICGRTFLPQSLVKHMKICEKNASKRRKPFDSQRQRVEGTDLALFHMPTFKKSTVPPPPPPRASSPPKPMEKKVFTPVTAKPSPIKIEIPVKIEAPVKPALPEKPEPPAKVPVRVRNSVVSSVATERCPHCERQFAARSYERHELWCREKHACKPSMVLNNCRSEAKERLDARLSYRVPTFVKRTVKEKYQPSSKEEKKNTTISTTNKSNTTSDTDTYNPFLTAERQLMELLECNDFKPYHKSTNKNHTQSKSPSSKPYKPIITNAGKTKKRQSVIDPPGDFKDTRRASEEDINFEMLENFINDNFSNEEMHKLDLDTISLDSCSTKNNDNTSSYFDDVSIDPRLINDFDNLSIPDHLDTHNTSTTTSKRYHPEPPEHKSDVVSNPVFYSMCSLSPKPQSSEVTGVKSEFQMSPLSPANLSVPFSTFELFSPGDEIYEEYKQLEETYVHERGEQLHLLAQSHQDYQGQAVHADSAYASLNRTPRTKIRSKVMQISPLEPPAYQIDHEKAQKKEENVDGAQIGARSSHAAGEKGDDGKISRNSHLQSVFAKFCHHCGKTYPIATAKFCVWCGHERLVL